MDNSQIYKTFAKSIIAIVLSAMTLVGCKPETPARHNDSNTVSTQKPKDTLNISEAHAAVLSEQFWEKGAVNIQELRNKASELLKQIDQLLNDTNKTNLAAAQAAWQAVFVQYQHLSSYFLLTHPSLNESLAQWPLALAANPLQPGYLDSYDIYTQSGLVNDIALSITADSLRKQHQLTDSEEVTLGIYAIEYILWGDKETRSVELYREQNTVPLAFAQAGLKVNELPQNRRRNLLKVQSELLLNDLDRLLSQWQNGGLLHTLYHQLSPAQRLRAHHQGLQAKLSVLEEMVSTAAEKKEDEEKANAFEERYQTLLNSAIREQLKHIETHYFSSTRIDDEKQATSLASSLLNSDEQALIKKRIKLITDKL